MKPFNKQYEEYKIEKSKKVVKIVEPEIKKNDGLDISVITGSVTKVTNFNKKK